MSDLTITDTTTDIRGRLINDDEWACYRAETGTVFYAIRSSFAPDATWEDGGVRNGSHAGQWYFKKTLNFPKDLMPQDIHGNFIPEGVWGEFMDTDKIHFYVYWYHEPRDDNKWKKIKDCYGRDMWYQRSRERPYELLKLSERIRITRNINTTRNSGSGWYEDYDEEGAVFYAKKPHHGLCDLEAWDDAVIKNGSLHIIKFDKPREVMSEAENIENSWQEQISGNTTTWYNRVTLEESFRRPQTMPRIGKKDASLYIRVQTPSDPLEIVVDTGVSPSILITRQLVEKHFPGTVFESLENPQPINGTTQKSGASIKWLAYLILTFESTQGFFVRIPVHCSVSDIDFGSCNCLLGLPFLRDNNATILWGRGGKCDKLELCGHKIELLLTLNEIYHPEEIQTQLAPSYFVNWGKPPNVSRSAPTPAISPRLFSQIGKMTTLSGRLYASTFTVVQDNPLLECCIDTGCTAPALMSHDMVQRHFPEAKLNPVVKPWKIGGCDNFVRMVKWITELTLKICAEQEETVQVKTFCHIFDKGGNLSYFLLGLPFLRDNDVGFVWRQTGSKDFMEINGYQIPLRFQAVIDSP